MSALVAVATSVLVTLSWKILMVRNTSLQSILCYYVFTIVLIGVCLEATLPQHMPPKVHICLVGLKQSFVLLSSHGNSCTYTTFTSLQLVMKLQRHFKPISCVRASVTAILQGLLPLITFDFHCEL